MLTRVYWADAPLAYCVEFAGVMSSDDVESAMQHVLALADSQPVCLLFDLRCLLTPTSQVLRVMSRNGALMHLINHPQTQHLLFVSRDPFCRFYVPLLAPGRVHLFPTRAEADSFALRVSEDGKVLSIRY